MPTLLRTQCVLILLIACIAPFGIGDSECLPVTLCAIVEEANLTLFAGLNLALAVDFGDFRAPDPGQIALFASIDDVCEPSLYSRGNPCRYIDIKQISRRGFDTIVECRDADSLLLPSGRLVLAFHMTTVGSPHDMDCEVVKMVNWIQTREFVQHFNAVFNRFCCPTLNFSLQHCNTICSVHTYVFVFIIIIHCNTLM